MRVCIILVFVALSTSCGESPRQVAGHTESALSLSSAPSSAPVTPDSDAASSCATEIPRDRTLEQQIAQTLMIFQPPGDELDPLWAPYLGGVFLEDTEVPAYLLSMKANSRLSPFIAVDDEGGRVQWRDNPTHPLPAPLELATLPLGQVGQMVRARGESLHQAGVDVTFAPVVDLNPGTTEGVIGDRAFSTEPEEIVRYARAYAEAFEDAGIITTLKHFPGHGLADGDSHLSLPATDPLRTLESRDLVPFRRLIKTAPESRWVMVGHLVVPGMTSGEPASLSSQAYVYLRQTLGHQGVVVTDELSGMRAISQDYTVSDAVIAALAAGVDLALIADPGDLTTLINDVSEAIEDGRLSRDRVLEAANRVLIAKACDRDRPAGSRE